MNQDQIKELLLKIKEAEQDFSVIFSGKSSKKVDGLYEPENREIIIHNKNFKEENELVYTAIHEYAHHIQFTELNGSSASRIHSVQFWDIFHNLLIKGEEKSVYNNPFKNDPRFSKLTGEIKDKYLTRDGELMKNFGKLLIEALHLCQENHASFEDYVDRELCLNRATAKSLMKVYALDINPEIGFENMKTVARISNSDKRKNAEKEFISGKSPDMVKAAYASKSNEDTDPVDRLKKEKKRIEKNIHNLRTKLAEIESKLIESGVEE